MTLHPLSRTQNNTAYGYSIGRGEGRYQLTYFLYMGDLKLHTSSRTILQSALDLTLHFSNDIGMELEFEKYGKVHLPRGEVDMKLGHKDQHLIETMTEKGHYKYIGVLRLRDPLQTATKENLLISFSKRLFSISGTNLNSANKIKGKLCASQISQLCEYLYKKLHVPHYNNICNEENGYIPLHLADLNCPNIRQPTSEQLAMGCREKSFHGQHLLVQGQQSVDKEAFNLWFLKGELFLETEGFVVAIQEKVIGTMNY